MRPIRLVAQAFGPFAERIDIDFSPALAQRLFGIYGPTGAGKTSLLDAMAFALFGESSGGERTRGHLRSDLADLETRTYVEFVFELGAKRYFVRREPEQELRSPRKDSRTYPATAAVFDATGLAPEAVSLETPGRPLAERKLKDVDDVLCGLLGYDAEQFRQVVMLPQGRFRALLTAGSDERSKILRGLFDVRIFERFAERLKAQAAGLEADVQAARREILTRLEDLGVDSAEALAQQIAERNTARLEAQAQRQALEAARTQAEAALAAGRVLAARFTEAATARAALADLQSRAEEVERLRQRLVRAEAARDLAPLETAARRAA
uniref:AAA family ATPase n=1 Tax=Phenylobacterium sp. TaxID=1871053 RepID=UPI0025F9B914